MGDEKLLKEMGLRINVRRKQLMMTQEQLAEKMDVSIQMISNLELGKKAIRPENIVKLSRALGVSTDYLLTGCRNARDYSIIDDKLRAASPQKYDRIMRMIDIMLEE